MKKLLAIVSIAAALSIGAAAQTTAPLMFEAPTVSSTHVAFSYAGDIWVVERQGRDARRLTTNPARENYPVFSPDGKEIAFTRLQSGRRSFRLGHLRRPGREWRRTPSDLSSGFGFSHQLDA